MQSVSGQMDTSVTQLGSPASTSDMPSLEMPIGEGGSSSILVVDVPLNPEVSVLPTVPLARDSSSLAVLELPDERQGLEVAGESISSVNAEEAEVLHVSMRDSNQTLLTEPALIMDSGKYIELTVTRTETSRSKTEGQFSETLDLPVEEKEGSTLICASELVSDDISMDEKMDRAVWGNKAEALLAFIGYAVGLGNVWRFPYLAYKHGGGAFVIPYTIMMATTGLPLFFLECAFGQFASLGPVEIWRIIPLFKGVGVTMVIISAAISVYYNVIVAYSLYYLFASFQSVLPWSDCFDWADENCSKTPRGFCNINTELDIIAVNLTWVAQNNLTCLENTIIIEKTELPSLQYWKNAALLQSSGVSDFGTIPWHLALCLLLAWVLVAAAVYKGIESSGKVVYVTSVFPYFILIVLLIRGLTLQGARNGIDFFFGLQSDISKLKNSEAWKDAATQVFYSLSTAMGGIATLASYNDFHNDCCSDAILVCVISGLTSLLSGFTIFAILGHMAFHLNKPVSEVVEGGFALAFIAYPEALTNLPVAPFWSILFFFMLMSLGLDSQFELIETITTFIQDVFPKAMKNMRVPITFGCCSVLFLLGLICVTQAGIYWVNLLDYFCGGWLILVSAVLEVMGISWIYGGNRFIEDVEMMLGKQTFYFWLWWRLCWFIITPMTLTIILFWSLITLDPPSYGTVTYPKWSEAVGWATLIFCIIWIPLIAILKIYKAKGNLWRRIADNCRAAPNWGPALKQNWGERYQHLADLQRDNHAW